MMSRTIDTLFSYWDTLRAGRIAPRRLDIEPSRIAGILSETFMLERVAADDYLFRLAGTRLCELFGYELRGTSFMRGWTEADRQLLLQQMAAVCDDGAVVHLTIEAGVDARHCVELEVVLLPLLHIGNRIGRVIGAMSPTTQPQWLDKARLSNRKLLRHEQFHPGQAGVKLPGERPPPFRPGQTGMRVVHNERRQFRVLDGGLAGPKAGKP